jgi:hypothetical protein
MNGFISGKKLKVIWTLACVITTLITAIWQLLSYLNGEDMTVIHYKQFHQEEIDLYPSIGLCFSNVLIPEKLEKYGISNIEIYSRFLAGLEWNQTLLNIDYDDVSLNLEDYIDEIGIRFTDLELITLNPSSENSFINSSNTAIENPCIENEGQKIPCLK